MNTKHGCQQQTGLRMFKQKVIRKIFGAINEWGECTETWKLEDSIMNLIQPSLGPFFALLIDTFFLSNSASSGTHGMSCNVQNLTVFDYSHHDSFPYLLDTYSTRVTLQSTRLVLLGSVYSTPDSISQLRTSASKMYVMSLTPEI